MEEIFAEIEMAIDTLDGVLTRVHKLKLKDPERVDRLNSIREQLNNLLIEMEDEEG